MKTGISIIVLDILLFLSFSVPVIAQGIKGNDAQENLYKIGSISADVGVVRKFDNRYEGVKGSPFFNDEWLDGSIEFEDGKVAEDVKLKYNIYEDELILLQPNVGSIYLDREKIGSFTLNYPEKFGHELFIKYMHPVKTDLTQYYRVVFAGKVNLLEHTKIVYEKANFQGGYSNDKKYDEFKQYPSYYSQSDTSPFPMKVKTTTSAIIRIFPDHQDQIKEFIKSNILDFRKPEDIVKVFRYYEEL
jgi:hypothetical protein